jgi:small nuclear ribonucleoprotein (snRNP)-like protein
LKDIILKNNFFEMLPATLIALVFMFTLAEAENENGVLSFKQSIVQLRGVGDIECAAPKRTCGMIQHIHENTLSGIHRLKNRKHLILRGGSFDPQWLMGHANNTETVNASRTPMVALQGMVGKNVVVALEEGIECIGTLHCIDDDFNLWLKGPVERWNVETGMLVGKDENVSIFIRGNNVVHVGRLRERTNEVK